MALEVRFASSGSSFDTGTAEICRFPVHHPVGQDFSSLLTAERLLKPGDCADLEDLKACRAC